MGLRIIVMVFFLTTLATGPNLSKAQSGPSLLDLVREWAANLQDLRGKIATYVKDGRMSLVDLYLAQAELGKMPGWILEEIFQEDLSLGDGSRIALPSNCLRTVRKGPALWILTGIHGEEPAGPNALAGRLDLLERIEKKGIPLVVMPLLNPLGYHKNWRYPDAAVYSEFKPGSSVGDSDHLLPNENGKARRPAAVCRQAGLLAAKVLDLSHKYPPVLVLDLHEDNLLEKGYLYSQGKFGADDRAAREIVALFVKNQFPILMGGSTRFSEKVQGGIVGAGKDGSIDELLSSGSVVVSGELRKGPSGSSVIVLETSSMNTGLVDRKKVHVRVLEALESLWATARAKQ
jgi:hypothetical protein